eukprot:2332477-Karenia_brevis.AAC.1
MSWEGAFMGDLHFPPQPGFKLMIPPTNRTPPDVIIFVLSCGWLLLPATCSTSAQCTHPFTRTSASKRKAYELIATYNSEHTELLHNMVRRLGRRSIRDLPEWIGDCPAHEVGIR